MRRTRLAMACAAAAILSSAIAACFEGEFETIGDAGDGGDGPDGSAEDGAVTGEGGTTEDGSQVGSDAGPEQDANDFDGALVIDAGPIDAGKAFDFAPPYVAQLGPSTRSDAGHNFAANTPKSNPWKTRCIDCHKVGGSAGSRPFFAGGSVYFLADAGPANMAEVRLKAYTSAKAVSAYTDNDGNWFIPLAAAQDAGVQFAVRPGIRNATLLRTMGPSPAIGVCNQCHGGANYL